MVGASFDTVEEQRAFAETESFPFALISDTDKSVGRRYHAEREPGEDYYEHGLPRRITYLIDPQGQIAAAYDLAGQDLAGHAAQVLADIAARS
ncbi:MAG: redoxin domain-containing protein [Acidimicrobiaceae bacterium]|nr:redoxin domain-containing protein [Acidimicrobiaceae bacterium]MYG98767.1 redoxin domain-containing protein [Acidimicrobiaceae bacterium]MYL05169.1 redoxin domain-containing protein [Acidimicrobiaceae bacterium]